MRSCGPSLRLKSPPTRNRRSQPGMVGSFMVFERRHRGYPRPAIRRTAPAFSRATASPPCSISLLL